MSFNEPIIYLLLSTAIVLLSTKNLNWRITCFTAINLVFVVLSLNISIISLLILGAFLFLHYISLQLIFLSKNAKFRSIIFWLWLFISLSGFIVVKQYQWITNLFTQQILLPDGIITIGLSFVFFRQLSLGIESRDGVHKKVKLLDYFNFNLAFWTFLAGPLQRFSDYQTQIIKLRSVKSVNANEVLLGLNRAAFGFIKMFIIAQSLQKYAVPETFIGDPGITSLLAFLCAFPAYIYINFSGYCDIVIGVARAVGFELPENFDHPYIARNLNEFWGRWHITLSSLLRDYLYFPIQIFLARRLPIIISMVLATLFSFLIMGVWHGNSISFAIFGLLHGIGVVIVNLYTEIIKKLLGKARFNNYRESKIIRIISILICQSYVLLTFLPFQYSHIELTALFYSLAEFMK